MVVLPWVSLILWGGALFGLLPSVVRLYRGPQFRRVADEWRGVVFFAALLFMLFNGRRLIMPNDAQAIIALYSISIALSAFVLILLRQEKR